MVNIQFQGIARGCYSVEKPDDVTIYELERTDMPLLRDLHGRAVNRRMNLERHGGSRDKDTHYEIIEEMTEDAMAVLRGKARHANYDPDTQGRPVVFLAVKDQKTCGMILGHMPQLNHEEQVVFSNRNRPRETEVFWLAAWPAGKRHVRGIGKLLLSQFFKYCQSLPVDKVFVRSSLPEYTHALKAYRRMGFRKSPGKDTIFIYDPHDPGRAVVDLTRQGQPLETDESQVLPLVVSARVADRKANEMMRQYRFKPGDGKSVDLSELIVK